MKKSLKQLACVMFAIFLVATAVAADPPPDDVGEPVDTDPFGEMDGTNSTNDNEESVSSEESDESSILEEIIEMLAG